MALDVLRRIGERLDGVSGCVGGGFLCRLCVEEIFYRAANAVEPLQCGRVKLFECCGGGFDKNRAVENPGCVHVETYFSFTSRTSPERGFPGPSIMMRPVKSLGDVRPKLYLFGSLGNGASFAPSFA